MDKLAAAPRGFGNQSSKMHEMLSDRGMVHTHWYYCHTQLKPPERHQHQSVMGNCINYVYAANTGSWGQGEMDCRDGFCEMTPENAPLSGQNLLQDRPRTSQC